MKKVLRTIRVTVLKLITIFAAIGLLISCCLLDSPSLAPFFTAIGCGAWLVLMIAANAEDIVNGG